MRAMVARDESGQAALLLALAAIVLMAAAGLAADSGWTFVQTQVAQNASDAAARAAAREIVYQQFASADTSGTTLAETNLSVPTTQHSEILSYSSIPAADPQDESLWYSGPPSSSTRTVRATVRVTFGTLFMGVVGIQTKTVTATSVATIYNTTPFPNWDTLFPLAIPVPAIGGYVPGASYYLWGPQAADFASYYNMPSQWKGLINMNNDPGTDTSTLSAWATSGYPGTINVGDQLGIVNGSAGNNVGSGLQAFILAHPFTDVGGTYSMIRIATFNAYTSSTQKVTISGFQVFKVYYNDVSANSAQGIFVGYLNLGGAPNTSSYTAFGPSTLKTTS